MVILLTEIMQLSMNQGCIYFIRGATCRRGGLAVQADALRALKTKPRARYEGVLSKIFPRRAVSAGDDSAAWFGK
jgi:hypothetical protein